MSEHQHGDDRDELRDRLDAVERALTDGAGDLDDLRAAADTAAELETLRDRVTELEDRTAELDAATQALRGYVGNVRSVNRDVERRADAALAKVESLEAELDVSSDANGAEPTDDSQPHTSSGGPGSDVVAEHERARSGRAPDTDGPSEPCRCVHCGAPRDDAGQDRSRARASAERGEGGGGDGPTGGRHASTDGGHEEWAQETATTRDESTDSGEGVLSGLRNVL